MQLNLNVYIKIDFISINKRIEGDRQCISQLKGMISKAIKIE